ncbi:hypothetical protein K439DRAFT_685189 [Ramaria rubella]|nr:hypothetical protein K439DRAFT_685189 [Ramaria rubella]
MEHDNEHDLTGASYNFYPHDESGYHAPLNYVRYEVVPNAQTSDMLQMRQLSLMPQGYPPGNIYPPVSPTRVAASMQLPPSPSPVDSSAYEHPISPPVSGSDASADGHTPHYPSHSYSRESSSGAGSPPAGRVMHRAQHRYHPTAAPSRTRRRRSSTNDEQDLSDDGEQDIGSGLSPQSTGGGMSGQVLSETLANSRKEATRRQRIEAEQRRRDELREGYARLKDVLPLSNQKSSKVSLLERATNYISNLDQSSKILHARLAALEAEVARLREINERLSLTVAHHTGQMPTDMDLGLPPQQHFDEHEHGHEHAGMDPQQQQRPLSPPPDVHPILHTHPLPPALSPLYHHRTDSSASGSQASGSEY